MRKVTLGQKEQPEEHILHCAIYPNAGFL